jgi:hypothetical protein
MRAGKRASPFCGKKSEPAGSLLNVQRQPRVPAVSPSKKIVFCSAMAFSRILASFRSTGPPHRKARQYGPMKPFECVSPAKLMVILAPITILKKRVTPVYY